MNCHLYYFFSVFFSLSLLNASCPTGPAGINQWQLIAQVANCISNGGGSCSSIDSVSDVIGSKLETCCSSLSALDCIIISDIDSLSTKIDSVSSKIDAISSKSDSCCSMLDVEIRSVSDVISNKIDQVGTTVIEMDACMLGTVITQADIPYTITTPGIYTVCDDIVVFAGTTPAITITARNVILNLNGHRVYSVAGSSGAIALACNNSNEITIMNGDLGSSFTTVAQIANCQQLSVIDVNVNAAGPTAFDIVDSFNVTLERVNCGPSASGGSSSSTIDIHGTSDGILLKSCTVFDANDNAFLVNISPATAHGIVFEDCHALRSFTPATGIGFSITTMNTTTPVRFTGCSADYFGLGFLISNSDNILFNQCSVTNCTLTSFNFVSCSQFTMKDCDSLDTPNAGFSFTLCNSGVIHNSNAIGRGTAFGSGYLLNSCVDILLDTCYAAKFASGFNFNASTGVIDTCSALGNVVGALISTNSQATIRRSEFDNNFTGINATATASSTDIIIKDCMVAHSPVSGIVDNSTPIWILDTRSINPGADSIAASTGAGTVITY